MPLVAYGKGNGYAGAPLDYVVELRPAASDVDMLLALENIWRWNDYIMKYERKWNLKYCDLKTLHIPHFLHFRALTHSSITHSFTSLILCSLTLSS